MRNFNEALDQSMDMFNKYFKELILKKIPGEFHAVEGAENEILKMLDMSAGIDLLHEDIKGNVRGFASRIQFDNNCWSTFTIRKSRESGAKTEYEKRKYAIKHNCLYPALTFQGYVYKDEVLGWAITNTKSVFWMIDNGYYKIQKTGKDEIGQAEFYVVSWSEMKKHKKIIIS